MSTDKEFITCRFCKCRTNAHITVVFGQSSPHKIRACCEQGRNEDLIKAKEKIEEKEDDSFSSPTQTLDDLTTGETLDACIGHIKYVTDVITGPNDWDRRTHKPIQHLLRARLLLDRAISNWEDTPVLGASLFAKTVREHEDKKSCSCYACITYDRNGMFLK